MTILAADDFTRANQSGWGTSTGTNGGQVWSLIAGSGWTITSNSGRANSISNNVFYLGSGTQGRLLLTDSGNQLWMKIFGRPPDDVPLSPKTREYFRQELFFRHRPEIGRVIFIASPLRGSNMATGWIGKIASLIIHESSASSEASQEMLRVTNTREEELKPKRRANSVDSLSPKSRFLEAMNTIPMTPGVPYNTIIGDRGRGDSPNSSDGVVPYWSSHMKGAESEDIVPSNHNAHQNPQAIAEVRRILRAHAH